MSKESNQSAQQSGIGTNGGVFQGATTKHTYNVKPDDRGVPEGNQAAGKHKRGKQGHG